MMDADNLLLSKIDDLLKRSDRAGRTTFSRFLSLREQTFLCGKNLKNRNFFQSGGHNNADRVIFAFAPGDAKPDFDIILLRFEPTDGAVLTHRDYLGAALALGIKREMIGDILTENGVAYLFCLGEIAPFLQENLTKAGRSTLRVQRITDMDQQALPAPKHEQVRGSISSNRLDNIVSFLTNKSRTVAANLIERGLVAANGMEVYKQTMALRDGDIISIRGFGKWIYKGTDGQSRKGKTYVMFLKFI